MTVGDFGEDVGEIGLRTTSFILAVSISEAWIAQYFPRIASAMVDLPEAAVSLARIGLARVWRSRAGRA